MIRVILIANIVGCMDQRMESERDKPYQQKNRREPEGSIFLKWDHILPSDASRAYTPRDHLSIGKVSLSISRFSNIVFK